MTYICQKLKLLSQCLGNKHIFIWIQRILSLTSRQRNYRDKILEEVFVSAGLKVIGDLQCDLPLPLGHLVPPEPVPVEAGEAVDHDGDGQGEDEQPSQGTKSADQTTKESLKQIKL